MKKIYIDAEHGGYRTEHSGNTAGKYVVMDSPPITTGKQQAYHEQYIHKSPDFKKITLLEPVDHLKYDNKTTTTKNITYTSTSTTAE